MSENKEYKKSVQDEIDWKIIDQLHSATLNFSSTSLELKKLLIVLIGIAVPALVKLAGDKLDLSLFVTIYLLSFTFWFLDSLTYYYQENLRELMDIRFNQIKTRNSPAIITTEKGLDNFTLDNKRTKKGRAQRSAFNISVRLYMVGLLLNTIGFTLYLLNII
jgi:hypothetical protein